MLRSASIFLSGVVLFLLGCEAALRLLPVSSPTGTGYFLDPEILSYPPHHRWTRSTGWDLRDAQVVTSNNLGFVARRDFTRDPGALGLVGDSHVEASMLDADARPDAQLERALEGRRRVYALGAPGTALLDYAERIRWAHQQLGIRDFVVVMEPGDMRQSICGSGQINGPCLRAGTFQPSTEHLPPASWLKRVLRHSAVAQYLFSQLKLDPGRLLRQLMAVHEPAAPAPGPARVETPQRSAAVERVADAFFERVRPHVEGRMVLVMDTSHGVPAADPSDPLAAERQQFIDDARRRGYAVVDAAPIYARHHSSSPLSLVVGPHDAHLNAVGVGLLMSAAAQSVP